MFEFPIAFVTIKCERICKLLFNLGTAFAVVLQFTFISIKKINFEL